jgi:dUTPase
MNNIPTYKFALREDLQHSDYRQFLPLRAEPKATGWDVRAAMPDRKLLRIKPFQQVKIPLGFRGFCPEGWWYELKPRSSTFGKKSLHALYGTIDETYEGELVFACQYIPEVNYEICSLDGIDWLEPIEWLYYCRKNELCIEFGEAIGQIIPTRREEMNTIEISNGEYNRLSQERDAVRKAGGFGSTGK